MATRESQLQRVVDISMNDYIRVSTAGGASRNALLSDIADVMIDIDPSVLALYQTLGWVE